MHKAQPILLWHFPLRFMPTSNPGHLPDVPPAGLICKPIFQSAVFFSLTKSAGRRHLRVLSRFALPIGGKLGSHYTNSNFFSKAIRIFKHSDVGRVTKATQRDDSRQKKDALLCAGRHRWLVFKNAFPPLRRAEGCPPCPVRRSCLSKA